MIEFTMPSLGADMEDGILCEWRMKPGDKVKRGDIIAEVETQKGNIEIEVFDEGTIEKLLLEVGTKVPVGTPMATIIPAEGYIFTKTENKLQAVGKPVPHHPGETEPVKDTGKSITIPATHLRASPLARKMAEEAGINLSFIAGTGPEGAITMKDVEDVIKKKGETVKETSAGAETIRKAVAAAMSRSNREIPHYYLQTEVEMDKALEWLNEQNKILPVKERLLPAVLLIKAVAKALETVPDLNAWWIDGLQRKTSINIGFVVSLRTGGIIVPALSDVNRKSLRELMASLNDIVPRARAMKLRSSELSESTITVTSLGDDGVETVFGVIYPPQVAIVGFGSATERVKVHGGEIKIKKVMTVTLSADHRATDGITGSRFLMALRNYLEQPQSL